MKLFSRFKTGSDAATAGVRVEPVLSAAMPVPSGVSRPEPWMHGIGFGSQSRVQSLPRVTSVSAQKHGTVFACCNVIAGDLSAVPLRLYQKGKDGLEAEVYDHPALYLLNTEPSLGVDAKTFRYALNYMFALRGRAFAHAPRDGGGELMMLDLIDVDGCALVKSGRHRFYDFTDDEGRPRRVPSRSMLHLRHMATDGWTGRSPIEVAAESVGIALAGQAAAAHSVTGTSSRLVIQLADGFEDDEAEARAAAKIKRALDEGKAPVIGADDKIESLDISAADKELLDSRKFDREMILGLYRVGPSKVQVLEHGVKANGQQQAIDHKTGCLMHWGGFVESQLTLSLLTEQERRGGLVFRHDFSALMEATTKEQYDALTVATGGPILTSNEARKRLRLAAVPEGEILNPPPNMTRKEKDKPDE